MIAALTPLLLTLGPVALLVAMALVFAETGLLVGFFLPGDTLLLALGVLAAGGALHLPLWSVVLGVSSAAAAGDQVGYLVGRHLGHRLLAGRWSRWVGPEHVARAERFFAQHGPRAVVLARFVAMARTFTPLVAGAAGMPRRQFTAYNLGGAAVWSVALLGAGYVLGGAPVVAAHVELFVLGVVAVSVVPTVVAVVRARSNRRARAAQAGLDADGLDAGASVEAPREPALV